MNALRLVPVLLSAVLVAAHFLRAGDLLMVGLCLGSPLVLLIKRPWVPRVMQAGLLLAAIVWFFTAVEIVERRIAVGASWTAAVIILGSVAAWTLGSASVFETRGLRERYRR